MPTREHTRKKIQEHLRTLRAAGFRIMFKSGEDLTQGGIRVALRGSDLYIASLDDGKTGLSPHYNSCCKRRDGLEIKAWSGGINSEVTLENEFCYNFYGAYPHFVPEDVLSLLKRGYEFKEVYMRKLNSTSPCR